MGLFQVIIWVSLGLASLTLAAMLVVIAVRLAANFHAHSLAARRAKLMSLGLEYLEEPEFLPALKAQLKPADRELLLKTFSDLLPKVRGEYAERVVTLMRELGLRDQCLAQLAAGAYWDRAEACALLGVFQEPAVTKALELMLDDPHLDVRVEAARSLARLGAVRSVGWLLEKLAVGTETNSLAVTEMFRSLGRDAVPELIAVLEGSGREVVKLLAVDALSHIGDLRVVPALLKLCGQPANSPALLPPPPSAEAPSLPAENPLALVMEANRSKRRSIGVPRRRRSRDPSTALRVAVVQALSALDDPRALPAVLQSLADPAWEVRAQAAACAGKLGSSDAIPRLERLLFDEQWWVRYHAAESLYRLGERGLGVLLAAAHGPVARAAEIAQGLLREKGLAA